jgi:hypothetical protein
MEDRRQLLVRRQWLARKPGSICRLSKDPGLRAEAEKLTLLELGHPDGLTRGGELL